MHKSQVGRVGGLAVAFGIGTAVLVGGGGGIAAADDTGAATSHDNTSAPGPAKGSSTGADSTTNETPKSTPKTPRGSSTAAGHTDADVDADAGEKADERSGREGEAADHGTAYSESGGTESDADTGPGTDVKPKRVAGKDNRSASKQPTARHPAKPSAGDDDTTAVPVARNDDVATPTEAHPPHVSDIAVEASGSDAITATVAASDPETEPPAPPAHEPTPTNVVHVVADAVSSIVTTLLSPFSTPAPESPAAQPQLWTVLAFARRELDTAVPTPSPTQGRFGDVTTGEMPTSLAQQTQVANSLTYTAEPNIIDQVTVLGLRVLRAVSNVIGVDFFAQFNKLLISNSPPFFLTYGLDARKTDVELTDGTTWKVWTFTPPNPTGKTVIAIHGSGFIYEPNLMQWYDYTSMARDTGATVVVPLYPLATTEAGSALNVVPDMADFIASQIDKHGAADVSVYGDSAGSIIAIAAVEQLVLTGRPVPSSMVLLSLTPDGSLSNPDIKNTDDPIIDVNNLGDYAASHWADGLDDPADPLYNALSFETLVGLPPTTIYVGSTEFVLPDTLLLHQKAVDEGAPISVVVGRGQIHDWALGGLPINSQAPVVRGDVYRQLGLIPTPEL